MKNDTNRRLYGYPDMGRTGLGHSLLAWARCVIWCEATGATMLPPLWLRPRLGPYLRGERDKREYFKLFRMPALTVLLKRAALLVFASKTQSVEGVFKEDIFNAKFLADNSDRWSAHVVVINNAMANNEVKFFHFAHGHAPLLRKRFWEMVKPQYHPKPSAPAIALHVRMGDFSIPSSAADLKTNNVRLPIQWYVSVLKLLRRQLGTSFPAIVYSDGSDNDLALLLAEPDVKRAPHQESVTDLMSISSAPVLVASGSGFSLWGAFFGEVPTIHYPGQMKVEILRDTTSTTENDGTMDLPESFLNKIKGRLKNSAGSVELST